MKNLLLITGLLTAMAPVLAEPSNAGSRNFFTPTVGGDRLSFWGGSLDCQKTLPYGTRDEVVREVEQHLRIFAPGGGYVLASVHNIHAAVPPEHVIALFEMARAAGRTGSGD